MVNSGPFLDTDVDRNVKGNFTQPGDALDASNPTGDAIHPCLRDTDFCRTADNGVVSAITFNAESMPEVNSDEVFKKREKPSLCCSVPLEKVKDVLQKYSLPFKEEDRIVQNGKNTITSRKLLCLYCERSFVTSNLRQKHTERCHSIKQIRRVSSRRFQNQNQQQTVASTTCTYCDDVDGGTDRSLKQLFHHLVSEHPTKYFGCLPCEDRFSSPIALQNHNANFHGVTENETRRNGLKSETSPKEMIENGISDSSFEEQNSFEAQNSIRTRRNKQKPKEPLSENNTKGLHRPPQVNSRKILSPQKVTMLQKVGNLPSRELRNKRVSVKSTKIGIKRSTRLQNKLIEIKNAPKKRARAGKITDPAAIPKIENITTNSSINPYPEFDSFFRVKKITDHSIDNLRISTLTFDDVFDKAFFNRIKCNIQENLLNHIDGKLFKNEESENRISNFEKITTTHQQDLPTTNQAENYGCEVSLNAATPVVTLLTSSQFGEDLESLIEYGSKASKRKTQTRKDEVNYKYFTRRKYQASILEHKENRDLSKLDMWTQLVIKERQQKIANDKKTAKELLDYTKCQEYQAKLQKDELNRILDKRGPFEDLRQEATKAALGKIDMKEESFTEVSDILNEIVDKIVHIDANEETALEINTKVEIPGYLNLRRSSSLPSDDEIDKSDKITLICSSQETENFDEPTAALRNKKELVELTGEWARTRIYICAACGTKVSNMKQLIEHKSLYHQNVWCQHFEFVGNQSELYKHLSIPGLGKVGVIEEGLNMGVWKKSDARMCSKCEKQCTTLVDLHRHILECGGDWSWMLARKKCKYRPFGTKSRRKRRGLIKRNFNPERKMEKRKYKKRFEGPRSKPSDAETIQRMLANLPAKRATRKMISLRDGLYRPRKTQNIQNGNMRKKKVKCGKVVCKTKKKLTVQNNQDSQNLQSNLPKRKSLRNINKVLTSRILDTTSKFKVKRKLKRLTQKTTENNISNLNPVTCGVTSDMVLENSVVNNAVKGKLKKETSKQVKTNNKVKNVNGSKVDLKTFFPVRKTRSGQNIFSTEIPEQVKETVFDTANLKNKRKFYETDKNVVIETNENVKPLASIKKRKDKTLDDILEPNPPETVVNNQPTKKVRRKVRKNIFQIKKKKKNKPVISNIVQVDGSSQEGKDTKNTFLSEKQTQETLRDIDDLHLMPKLEKIVPVTPEKKDALKEIPPILSPINLSFKPITLNELFKEETIVRMPVHEPKPIVIEENKIEAPLVAVLKEVKVDSVQIPKPNGLAQKPKLKMKKPSRGLNDCIAMLTNKLQQKSESNNVFSNELLKIDKPKIEEQSGIKENTITFSNEPCPHERKQEEPSAIMHFLEKPFMKELPAIKETPLDSVAFRAASKEVSTVTTNCNNIVLPNETLPFEEEIAKTESVVTKTILSIPNIKIKKDYITNTSEAFLEPEISIVQNVQTVHKQPNDENIATEETEKCSSDIPNEDTQKSNNEDQLELDDMEVEEMNTNALIIENKIVHSPYSSAPAFNHIGILPHLNYKIDYILNNIPAAPLIETQKTPINPVRKKKNRKKKVEKLKIVADEKFMIQEEKIGVEMQQTANLSVEAQKITIEVEKVIIEEKKENTVESEKENEIKDAEVEKKQMVNDEASKENETIVDTKEEAENSNNLCNKPKNKEAEDSEDEMPLSLIAKRIGSPLEIKNTSHEINTNETIKEEEKTVLKIKFNNKDHNLSCVVNGFDKSHKSPIVEKSDAPQKPSESKNVSIEKDTFNAQTETSTDLKSLTETYHSELLLEEDLLKRADDVFNFDPSEDDLQMDLIKNLQTDLIQKQMKSLDMMSVTIDEVVNSLSTAKYKTNKRRRKSKRTFEIFGESIIDVGESNPVFGTKTRKNKNGARRRTKTKRFSSDLLLENETHNLIKEALEASNLSEKFEQKNETQNLLKEALEASNLSEKFEQRSKNGSSFLESEEILEESSNNKTPIQEDIAQKTTVENAFVNKQAESSLVVTNKIKKRNNGVRKNSKNDVIVDEIVENISVSNSLISNVEEEEEKVASVIPAVEFNNCLTQTIEPKIIETELINTSKIERVPEILNEDNLQKDTLETQQNPIKETSLEDLTNIDHVNKTPVKRNIRNRRSRKSTFEVNENSVSNEDTQLNDDLKTENVNFKTNKKNNSAENESTFCDICNKVFKRPDSLVKHKRTLTHIAKLSEIEAREAALKNNVEDKVEDKVDSLENISFPTPQPETTPQMDAFTNLKNDESLKLVDIINDVLNKPIQNDDSRNDFANMILQSAVDLPQTEMRRYKSLGERKSFELDLNFSSKTNSSDYFMSKTDTILEKQISLLENIIENHSSINYVDDITISSMSSLSKREDSNQTNYKEKNFLKPTQYEEISEESTNVRGHFDEQKSRKILNRDEELFLECCSLLKSGSEISNYSKTSNKKSVNGLNMDFKSVDEPEWLEKKFLSDQRQLNEASNGFISDDSPIPTPLGDSFVDDASNSNTISSSWQTSSNILDGKSKNGEILSTSFIFNEIIEESLVESEKKTRELTHEVPDSVCIVEEEETNKSDSSISNGFKKKAISKFGSLVAKVVKNKFNEITKNSKDRSNEEVCVPEESPDIVNDGAISPSSCDNKKMLTKGAMKVFEGLKVSIPTEELNMAEVLNCSPTLKRLELGTEKEKEVPKKEPVIFKTKLTKKKAIKPKLQLFKTKIKTKLTKKKVAKKAKTPNANNANKTFDVYDFEETQDNLDSSLSMYRSFRNNSGQKPLDEFNLEVRSESSTSSCASSKKVQNITKKKCMIMGRIFKNAIKSKVDEDIRDIPMIDSSKFVENYVMNCPILSDMDEKKQKMTVDEMDRLFDKLLANQEETFKNELSVVVNETESKKKKFVKPLKPKRRNRANSESTDDEFSLNKAPKKRRKKKNSKSPDDVINLEQELKECIGVASRKSQRKCTSGKQNVLVEFWSSDESMSEALLQSIEIKQIEPIEVKLKEGLKEIKETVQSAEPEPEPEPILLKEVAVVSDDVKEKVEEEPNKKHSRTKSTKYKSSMKKISSAVVTPTQADTTTETLATNRRKRSAADTLYYWSSSSEDEFQDMIEVKPIRDELDDDDERPIQHGWIVGDSPKKLVTMLAQAKGKKTDSECVKEQGKKRTASSCS